MPQAFNAAMRQCLVCFAFAPAAALAQGYSLNGASMGTNAVRVTIPKSGNAQSVQTLRLQFSGGGATCNTGALADYWSPSGQPAPRGITPGYSRAAMMLPSSTVRPIVINVDASAQPGSRQWTLVVPKGSCGGANQTATVTVTLER